MAQYDIFLSYRRKGGYDTAKHLYDLLSKDGYRVSFDIDTLRSGDFDTALFNRIDQCKDFILIVDEHAFDRTLDPDFNPQNDWMRQELAYALSKGKNIVPIFLSGKVGFPENLPADIAAVVKKNGPEFNRYYFDEFYETLKKRFLSKRHNGNKGIWFIVLSILLSVACLVYSFIHESEGGTVVTVSAILAVLSFVLMIVGLSNPGLLLLKSRNLSLWYLVSFFLSFMAFGAGSPEDNSPTDNSSSPKTEIHQN